MTVDLSPTLVQWRGLTLSGQPGSPFGVSTVQGWDELPSSRYDSMARPQAHGRFDTTPWSDERIVTVGGACTGPDRDALLRELSSVMTWPSGRGSTEPLVITRAGRTLTGFARLTAFKVPTDENWAVGNFPYALEFRCPDPLRYGDPVSQSTPFPTLRGGLEYDLYTDGTTDTGVLEYGDASDTGRMVLTNDGTADIAPVFQVSGPVPPEGFDIAVVGTDQRLRFSDPVAAGSVLVIDSATGAVVIDGTADRGGRLTYRDWFSVPAGRSVEIAFINLGTYSTATMTAITRPGWW